ncbi:hypothetical protein [Streptomyces sp. NPDC018352]|uniref:hypothetical protein n=1 Tax=Streptomyces sp. NPDC018352 TaxID=3157194 RepID=UPI0033E98599
MWLAHTDADSRVPRDWLASHLTTQPAAGRQLWAPSASRTGPAHSDSTAEAFPLPYQQDQLADKHRHVHGASAPRAS